ncbi:hypothetical protein [Pyxidicoccus xibeiensis]|uniref:hypothetical protein n=1 Tax=Pyxidicoccus xibeiensis TaxID=2906759 RepID=UPI0020A7A2AB|nr:hypothetical protein [Pyxidicoccus xibeiensis]MCP3137543.1 hypothetical protein [Pyxidicoccus xibeiensis]
MTTYPRSVQATCRITDEGRVCAERGAVGIVLDAQTYADGTQALTVAFPDAPCATTCVVGEDVKNAPTLAA